MQKQFFSLCFLLLFSSSFAQDVLVNGYTRTDGTTVPTHYRTNPDYTVNNNFTTIGNTNPYTGKVGTLPGDNGYSIQSPQSSINIPLIENSLSNSPNKGYTISVTTPLSGGYSIPTIIEQVLENGKWATIKTEANNGYLFFDKNLVYFKRGQNKWLVRNQVFIEHNTDKRVYIYNSEFGVTVLDEYLKFILFYDVNNTAKRYFYIIGNSVSTISPID